MEEKEKKENN